MKKPHEFCQTSFLFARSQLLHAALGRAIRMKFATTKKVEL